ncbi:MAG TPA: transcription termination/antitermination protein NusG [bacterium]|nr:transcription termination/antitermination protein NusG [bacterium]
MKWYAIHTQSGQENKLRNAILKIVEDRKMQDHFGEIIVPEVEIEEKKGDKKRKVRKNLYPGYVFIQMHYSDEAWLLIKSVAFIRKPAFVGEKKRFDKNAGIKPTPITAVEIERIRKMMQDGEIKKVHEISFEKGETILIKDGAFAGFKAVIDDIKEGKEKLDVLVNIFGRSTPVELSFSQVEKVED